MKVFIQWATDPKSSPEEIDSSQWASLAKKMDPTGTRPMIDGTKGWIQSISVMGITFKADHYAISENPRGYPVGSISVTFWNDSDPDIEKRHGAIWYFQALKLRDVDGIQKWIPNSWEERFYSDTYLKEIVASGEAPIFCNGREVKLHKYAEFIAPDESITKHGVLLKDSLNEEFEAEKNHNYREWA